MSTPSFLHIPVKDGKAQIIPRNSVLSVIDDCGSVLIKYRVGRSVDYIRPDTSMSKLAEALGVTFVVRED